jgi:hypothetical protein
MGKLGIHRAQLKKRALGLLKSVEEVILEETSQAEGFENAADFRKSLLAALEAYKPFHVAVRDYHGKHGRNESAAWPAGQGRKRMDLASSIQKNSGRVQAPRYDPSSNQKDRRQGKRQPGGKRIGQGQGKSPKA